MHQSDPEPNLRLPLFGVLPDALEALGSSQANFPEKFSLAEGPARAKWRSN
jgi:hypothetical protein